MGVEDKAHIYVVTGIGMITPVGRNLSENWANITSGRCGVDRVSAPKDYPNWDLSSWPVQIASQVPDFNYTRYIREGVKELKKGRPRQAQLALEAGGMALQDSGLIRVSEPEQLRVDQEFSIEALKVEGLVGVEPHEIGIAMGTTAGGALEAVRHAEDLRYPNWESKFSPFAAVDAIPDTLASAVSMTFGTTGTYYVVGSACSSGANSIIRAIETLENHAKIEDGVRVMLAFGVECQITPVGMAAFIQNKALTRDFNYRPGEASRPFDSEASGFVMGEAGSALVIESLEHAEERGAKIYGVIDGFGETRDAGTSLTFPDGVGSRRAMKMALAVSGLSPSDIEYVNAHATSTNGDKEELRAILAVFGRDVLVSSTKGQTGHLVGAGGNVELAYCLQAFQEGNSVPPGINLINPVAEANFVTTYNPNRRVNVIASNSFAFGGHNVTLIVQRYDKTNLTEA